MEERVTETRKGPTPGIAVPGGGGQEEGEAARQEGNADVEKDNPYSNPGKPRRE